MVCGSGGPGAEAIVVLGGVDHAAHAGFLEGAHYGFGIEIAGVEQLRRFITIAPLAVRVGIQPEMHKGIPLHTQPLDLLLGGHRAIGLRCVCSQADGTPEQQRHTKSYELLSHDLYSTRNTLNYQAKNSARCQISPKIL